LAIVSIPIVDLIVALARSGPPASGSGVARRIVACVFRRTAGSQHTTTRRAPHALRRWRQIRPTLVAHSALASRSIAARQRNPDRFDARHR